MEPKRHSPEINPSHSEVASDSPTVINGYENAVESQIGSLEAGEVSHERAAEFASQAQAATIVQPGVVALPTPVITSSPPVDDTLVAGAAPAVAADEDLIEKEWVDKAKQIISQTKDDPARREREVSRLQADYLKKRYGKEIGIAPE